MTEEMIKENISKAAIRMLAAFDGYGISTSENDYGIDLSIVGYGVRNSRKNQNRQFELPDRLRLQLKSTTENQITRIQEGVKYKLKSKNYNDLVEQRQQISDNPLVLFVIIFPDEKEKWLHLDENKLLLTVEIYYYLAEDNASLLDNEESTKTILLKKDNKVDIGIVDRLYKEYANAN